MGDYGYSGIPYMQAELQANRDLSTSIGQASEGISSGIARGMAATRVRKNRERTLQRQAEILGVAADNYRKYIRQRFSQDPDVSSPGMNVGLEVPLEKTPKGMSEEELQDRVIQLNRAVSALGSWIMSKDQTVKPEKLQAIAVYGPDAGGQTGMQNAATAQGLVNASTQQGYGAPTSMPNGVPIDYSPGPEGQQYYTPQSVATAGGARDELLRQSQVAGVSADPTVVARMGDLANADVSQRQAAAMDGTKTQADAYVAGMKAVPTAGKVSGGAQQIAGSKPTDYQQSRMTVSKMAQDLKAKYADELTKARIAEIYHRIDIGDLNVEKDLQDKSKEARRDYADLQKLLTAASTPQPVDPLFPDQGTKPLDTALIRDLTDAKEAANAAWEKYDNMIVDFRNKKKSSKGKGKTGQTPFGPSAAPAGGAGGGTVKPPLSSFRR